MENSPAMPGTTGEAVHQTEEHKLPEATPATGKGKTSWQRIYTHT
jgi:hypothetical protein